jgi:hypothetical protein
MKVDGYGNIKSASNVKKRYGVAQSGGFSELLESSFADEVASNSGVGEVSATAQMSGLFALQEVSDDDVRKQLLKQGNNVLDSLENLRRGLLLGNMSMHVLRDIEHKIAAKRAIFNDPKLSAILDEIELRAAVEIAKLEMAIAQRN